MELVIFGFLIFIIFILLIFLLRSNHTGVSLNKDMNNLITHMEQLKEKQFEIQNNTLKSQQDLFYKSHNSMSENLKNIMQIVNDNLNKTQNNINTQLGNTDKVVQEVHKKLGALEVTTKNIQEISKDISSLQEILQAPKLRGNLGEYLLADLLKQIFPNKNYELQYSFKNGCQVDAIIKLGDNIIPIDAKFPLESFQRYINTKDENEQKKYKKEFIKSVKERINEICSKYINPQESTFDFALMYIPAENIFYETVISDTVSNTQYEIFDYAIQKHVIPVSPNSFYAYLMAIAYGLKGFQIEKKAKLIIEDLSKVQSNFSKFYQDFAILGKHIEKTNSKYDETVRRSKKVNDSISRITGSKIELEDIEINEIEQQK